MNAHGAADGHGLFYLMGPSGSGKDSLLRALRERLGPDDRIVIAHRYITREADANEASVALTPDEFRRRQALGCLALDWHSHGLHYGIGIEIEQWLARGLTVIVNGSREYLPQAWRATRSCAPCTCASGRRCWPRGCASVAASRKQRLPAPARAAQAFTVPAGCRLVEFDNSGALETAAEAFAQLVGATSDSATLS